MAENVKCAVVERQLTPCRALARAIDGSYSDRRKGVALLETLHMKTMTTYSTAAILRSGEFVKKGIVVNYCPFCGESIAQHLRTAELAEVQDG